ncbi:MAG: chloride channel protein [Flavobacteriales bacterium]|nr:chloride channel protein [Flavobacteriales bacterium]
MKIDPAVLNPSAVVLKFRRLVRYLADRLGTANLVLLLAGITGVASGLIAVVLKNGVVVLRGARDMESVPAWILPTTGLALTWVLVRFVLQGRHPGTGIPATLHAISKRRARLARPTILSPVLTSILTVGFGGSAGLEAPAVQSSAAVGSNLGDIFKLDYRHRLVLIGCAATASLAAIFKAPLAAIVFAVEVIMIDLTTGSLMPLLVASLSALLTTHMFIDPEELISAGRYLSAWDGTVVAYLPFGVLCGLGSVFFAGVYRGASSAVQWPDNKVVRIAIAGAAVGGAVVMLPALYGEGFEWINALLQGETGGLDAGHAFTALAHPTYRLLVVASVLWLLKPALTGLTVGAGGVGGIFAPALFCGALLGATYIAGTDLLWPSLHLNQGHFVLAGMAGLMAGILRAPLTAIFLAAEVSGGYDLFIPLMLTSAIAFQTAKLLRKNSIYTQELAERGELITHDKDKAVLTLMRLKEVVESDFEAVHPDDTLGQLVEAIARSRRNMHPVLNENGALLGLVPLEEIRSVIFDQSLYQSKTVRDLMVLPTQTVDLRDHMEKVMEKFDKSGAWNLPVVEQGRYVGFVSKSNLFSAYRKWLQEFSSE